MNEKEEVNGLSDIYVDPNRTSESTVPDIAGKISADCENLGQTLRTLADELRNCTNIRTIFLGKYRLVRE